MLTQAEVEVLLALIKVLADGRHIDFPPAGSAAELVVNSEDGRERFLIDVNRKGKIKVSKCTFQERYQVVEILLRLDIDGPTHENPDGEEIPCPHLHIYREGFADKWAHPLPASFTNTANLAQTLREFLAYCRVKDAPEIQEGLL